MEKEDLYDLMLNRNYEGTALFESWFIEDLEELFENTDKYLFSLHCDFFIDTLPKLSEKFKDRVRIYDLVDTAILGISTLLKNNKFEFEEISRIIKACLLLLNDNLEHLDADMDICTSFSAFLSAYKDVSEYEVKMTQFN